MFNTIEMIKKGFNGFEWCGKLYKISFVKDGMIYAKGEPDRSEKKIIPEIALDEEDFKIINLNKEERENLNKFNQQFGY